jgi:diaminopimelate decarboxylase
MRRQPVRFLNLGGGFGIPYFPGEQPLDLAPIGANLASIVERAARELPAAELVIELGRYLVGEAGIYVARIVDRKVSRGRSSWSATAACTTICRHRATSAR